MTDSEKLSVLKSALLLEQRGRSFYNRISVQAENSETKKFFRMMAEEEALHIAVLTEQFKHLQNTDVFKQVDFDNAKYKKTPSQILTDELKKEISSVEYEAAAISAAISLEKNAINLYSKRAQSATDPFERDTYSWLAQWEQTHLDFLIGVDKELTERIWNDNSFWPF